MIIKASLKSKSPTKGKTAQDDESQEKGDETTSQTYPVLVADLKKGDLICIKGFPCRVVEIMTCKTGSYGHAKVNVAAVDIFTGKKYEEISPSSDNLPAPFVKKVEYQLVDIQSGRLSLLSEENDEVDFPCPPDEELMKLIQTSFDEGKDVSVVVVSAMGIDQVMDVKVKQG